MEKRDCHKETLEEDEFYKSMGKEIHSKIMRLPGAWIRRAFSYIGGTANKEYETIALEISNGVKQNCDGYLNEKTKELQEQNQDYKSRLSQIEKLATEKIEQDQ